MALIGMMGCGKSVLATAFARQTGRTLHILDQEIAGRADKSIPEIFAQDGEDAFRNWEALMARESALWSGAVIDCGGGIVVREETVRLLKQNCLLVFIERPIEEILKTLDRRGRPLAASGDDAFRRLYCERLPLYRACADASIINRDFEEALNHLIHIEELL